MRYLLLLIAASISVIKASPIDDLRRQINKLENDLQAEIHGNNDLRKKVEKLEDKLDKESHQNNGLRKDVEKLQKQVRKLKIRVTDLETASTLVLEVMPYLSKAVEGETITLNQREFTHLVSLIPLQSISPNIIFDGASYTVEISNILSSLMVKIVEIFA